MNHGIIWFRRDLRVADQAAFAQALSECSRLSAVVFEPPDLRPHPREFFWQCARDLRSQLRRWNIDLHVLAGSPADVLPDLIKEAGADAVYATAHANVHDQREETELQNRCPVVPVFLTDQLTLIPWEDVPPSARERLGQFTAFRQELIKRFLVPPEVPPPRLRDAGSSWRPRADLLAKEPRAPLADLPFGLRGGETAALMRLHEYLSPGETAPVLTYKETRNGLLRRDDSTKLSPFLARGCLSPRQVYWEIRRFEARVFANASTQWVVYELMWRDYFKYFARQHGESFFARTGIRNRELNLGLDVVKLDRWTHGETGESFVDANMRELWRTGWMSNRGRQNVASFWAKTWGMDWRAGAEWFSKSLIDDDPESNYGNWGYLAGVGTDPRDRVFDVKLQAEIYDPMGEYQRRWQ